MFDIGVAEFTVVLLVLVAAGLAAVLLLRR